MFLVFRADDSNIYKYLTKFIGVDLERDVIGSLLSNIFEGLRDK